MDTLKIDRSCVERIGLDNEDAAIVQSVIALAKRLHASVAGRGIENQAEAAQLRRLAVIAARCICLLPEPVEAISALLLDDAKVDQDKSCLRAAVVGWRARRRRSQ